MLDAGAVDVLQADASQCGGITGFLSAADVAWAYQLLLSCYMALYGIKVPLSVTDCWLVVIGGLTNPTIFVIAAFKPDFWEHQASRIYTAGSFAIATIGFLWVCKDILAFA